MLRKSQENEKNLRAAEEVLKQSTLTTFILYVALVASFSAVWWPDKSWFQGSMVTAIGWVRRTRDLTWKTKPMNQCRFNVKVHRFGFLPQLISMQTTMMAASHRLFEPEMPKVFFIENWLGFSNFVHVFPPVFFLHVFNQEMNRQNHASQISKAFVDQIRARILRKFVHLHAIEVWRRASSRAAESRRGASSSKNCLLSHCRIYSYMIW